MRKALKEIDVDFNKMVSLTEFFIYHYKLDYKELVNNVVDDTESQEKLQAAKQALAAAEKSNEEAAASAAVAEKDAQDSSEAAEAAKSAADEGEDTRSRRSMSSNISRTATACGSSSTANWWLGLSVPSTCPAHGRAAASACAYRGGLPAPPCRFQQLPRLRRRRRLHGRRCQWRLAAGLQPAYVGAPHLRCQRFQYGGLANAL